MLNLYLKLSLTSFKNKFQQKQMALYKSYASAQSENPDQLELSHAWVYLSCDGDLVILFISKRALFFI